MLFNELPIVFPWYDKEEQMNRFNENTETICDFKLITPANALLPFQFNKEAAGLPEKWYVFEVNSGSEIADLTASIPVLRRAVRRGLDYFTYDGRQLPMSLPPGFYKSELVFANGIIIHSEMFFVPENRFNIADDDDIEYLKFVWYNKGDIAPIFYNDPMPDTTPYFKNVLYIDSFITASEPEIVEDGERDGDDELIATFQKVIINYRITVVVPNYLKNALVLIPMHDVKLLTTKKGVRTGEMYTMTVNSALEANGGLSVVDLLFTQTVAIVKKGCAQNMT